MVYLDQMIEIVNNCIAGGHCKDCVKRSNRSQEAFTTCKSVMKDSVEILEHWRELFTPKKPNEIKPVGKDRNMLAGYCDSCGALVFGAYAHCPNCGQALLWKEK